MNTILVTGAYGFVGTNLSEYLKSKEYYRQIALDIQKKEVSNYDEGFIWDDLDQFDFNSIDAIIHLAGKAHDTKNTSQAEEYFKINVGLTQIIFDKFLKSNATKFIYFSSVKAVTDSVKNEMLTEDDTPNPQTPYGQSKLKAEEYILSQELPRGKKIYILRPAMIHGPGNKGNLNLLYKLVLKGIPYPLGAFLNQRSFTSIDNLNFIIEQLLIQNIPSGIYQIADSESLSTNELIELIALSIGKKSRILDLPVGIIRMAARLGDLLPLPLNSEKLKKLTENYNVSNKKLIDSLGITLPFTAKEGMNKTLKSFRLKNMK